MAEQSSIELLGGGARSNINDGSSRVDDMAHFAHADSINAADLTSNTMLDENLEREELIRKINMAREQINML